MTVAQTTQTRAAPAQRTVQVAWSVGRDALAASLAQAPLPPDLVESAGRVLAGSTADPALSWTVTAHGAACTLHAGDQAVCLARTGPEGVELMKDAQGLTHVKVTLAERVVLTATVRPDRVLFASTEAMRLLALRGGRYELLDGSNANTSPTPDAGAFMPGM